MVAYHFTQSIVYSEFKNFPAVLTELCLWFIVSPPAALLEETRNNLRIKGFWIMTHTRSSRLQPRWCSLFFFFSLTKIEMIYKTLSKWKWVFIDVFAKHLDEVSLHRKKPVVFFLDIQHLHGFWAGQLRREIVTVIEIQLIKSIY